MTDTKREDPMSTVSCVWDAMQYPLNENAGARAREVGWNAMVNERDSHIAFLTAQKNGLETTIKRQSDELDEAHDEKLALKVTVTRLTAELQARKDVCLPVHHPVGTEVYCRHTAGVRKSRIEAVVVRIGHETMTLNYVADGCAWLPEQLHLTAAEAFARS